MKKKIYFELAWPTYILLAGLVILDYFYPIEGASYIMIGMIFAGFRIIVGDSE